MAQYFAYETLTVSTTATGLTSATFGDGNLARIYVDLAPVRFRLDAGTPTSSVGEKALPGDVITLESPEELARIKFISANGASASLMCNYGKSN